MKFARLFESFLLIVFVVTANQIGVFYLTANQIGVFVVKQICISSNLTVFLSVFFELGIRISRK